MGRVDSVLPICTVLLDWITEYKLFISRDGLNFIEALGNNHPILDPTNELMS